MKNIIPEEEREDSNDRERDNKRDASEIDQYFSKEGELDVKDLSESHDSDEDEIADNVDDYDKDPDLRRRPTALLFSTDKNARKSVSIANFLASNLSKSMMDDNVKAAFLAQK